MKETTINSIPGQRIKALREELEMTQQDLAPKIGTDPSTLSLCENGKRNVPKEVQVNAAKFFGVSIDYLEGLTDSRNITVFKGEYKYNVNMNDFFDRLNSLGLINKNGDIDKETLDHMFKVIEANKNFIKRD